MAAAPAAAADPPLLTVRSVTPSGEGCRPGDDVRINDQGDALQVAYVDFRANTPATSSHPARESCMLTILLDVPEGWQYRVAAVRFSGWGKRSAEARATVKASAYFSNQPAATPVSVNPLPTPGKVHDFDTSYPLPAPPFSPCGQSHFLYLMSSLETAGPPGATATLRLSVTHQDVLLFEKRSCS